MLGEASGEEVEEFLGIVTFGKTFAVEDSSFGEHLVRVEETVSSDQSNIGFFRQEGEHLLEHSCCSTFAYRYRTSYTNNKGELLLVSTEEFVYSMTHFVVLLDMKFQQACQRKVNFFDFRIV